MKKLVLAMSLITPHAYGDNLEGKFSNLTDSQQELLQGPLVRTATNRISLAEALQDVENAFGVDSMQAKMARALFKEVDLDTLVDVRVTMPLETKAFVTRHPGAEAGGGGGGAARERREPRDYFDDDEDDDSSDPGDETVPCKISIKISENRSGSAEGSVDGKIVGGKASGSTANGSQREAEVSGNVSRDNCEDMMDRALDAVIGRSPPPRMP